MTGESEVSLDDIREVCDEVCCDTNQVIGLLLELNIIIAKAEDLQARNGRSQAIKCNNVLITNVRELRSERYGGGGEVH